MKPIKKQAESKKPLSIRQILIDTNTDDKTIAEFLKEGKHSFSITRYSEEFINNHNLGNPSTIGVNDQ